jgi:hypothetical protein
MNSRVLESPPPFDVQRESRVSKTIQGIRWNDARARWLMGHAAEGLGLQPPATGIEEFEWVTSAFPDSSAMTLYLAARSLADGGRLEDALDVLGDACRAQRGSRPTMRAIPSQPPAAPADGNVTGNVALNIRDTRPAF